MGAGRLGSGLRNGRNGGVGNGRFSHVSLSSQRARAALGPRGPSAALKILCAASRSLRWTAKRGCGRVDSNRRGRDVIEAQQAAQAGQAATGALVVFAIVQAFMGTAWLLFLAGIHLISATLALLLALVSELACWILVPIWIYRAMAAARRSAPSLKTSPRWAVGWLFVPLAGLWKPFETMGQIWQGSQSKRYADSASNPSTMNYWWFVWLVHMACLLACLPACLLACLARPRASRLT
jgi:hypothetical protein